MENLSWGLQMTVLGMGLVFALLALLWVVLTVVLKLDKEKEEETPVSALEAQDKAERIAAIADEAIGAQTPETPTVHGMAADLVSAIMIAAMKHKMILRGEAAPLMRTALPGTQPSRWAAAGRVRQTNTWTPRGK
jgi:Na+-transporting methylmalonyl-CoA/oxaloacetate decarboxylase gamma subunit